MIIDFNKKKVEIDLKKNVIFETFKEFYKEKAGADGVDIPYFMYAKKAYDEKIKSIKDVNKWYKRITGEVK